VNVTLLAVGRAKGPLADAIAEYESRAARYWRFEAVTVDAGSRGSRSGGAAVREAEGERLLGRLKPGGQVLALTRDGIPMDSMALSSFLQEQALRSTPSVTFVIGGAFGLADAVLARADRRLSLSPMTLPHDLARLVLAEQLYRAGTIGRGEPYHKGTAR